MNLGSVLAILSFRPRDSVGSRSRSSWPCSSAFLVMLPFARMELPAVHSFVPTIQTALLINRPVHVGAPLFAQFSVARQRAILVLATGDLFTGADHPHPHAPTFPGAFSTTGLLVAGWRQTSHGSIFSGTQACRWPWDPCLAE